jgi:hypothetical protein
VVWKSIPRRYHAIEHLFELVVEEWLPARQEWWSPRNSR